MRSALPIAVLAALTLVPATAASAAGRTVKVADSDYGPILVDGRGITLYLFTKDGTGRSRCYGACADAWPPYIVKRKPRARAGADAERLGTTKRRHGARQLTYAGKPVYYYVGEDEPGEIFCQDVFEFGGRWLLVDPDGDAVT